jgi:hypothetical protein
MFQIIQSSGLLSKTSLQTVGIQCNNHHSSSDRGLVILIVINMVWIVTSGFYMVSTL